MAVQDLLRLVVVSMLDQGNCLDWGVGVREEKEEAGKEDEEEEVEHCYDFFQDRWLTRRNWLKKFLI